MTDYSQPILFGDLNLSPALHRAVAEMDYTEATGIQAAAIPPLLAGRDVIGKSRTGTGKTAAFGIPAVECVEGRLKRPQVLAISPTRELCMQIAREMQKYAKYKEGVSVVAVYGGAPITNQIHDLRYANIVIGTPGRLLDHLRRKTLKTEDLKMVVLDEADEMLSMGFIEDIREILVQTPETRQTALFSATIPAPVLKIAEDFLTDPQIVDQMGGAKQQPNITQTYYCVSPDKKLEALTLLLRYGGAQRNMVFCNTKSMVAEVAEKLSAQGFLATGLHGDMAQPARSQVMQGFRSGRIKILVATDVAARGIDVDDVDAVINYDLPQSFEYYIHRIGRTGRAGKAGLSQTLICNNRQMAQLHQLIKFTGKDIKECSLPSSADLMRQAVDKTAAQLQAQLQQKPGQAARMLVQQMQAGNPPPQPEELALALAEQLLGGDAKFQLPSGLSASFGKPTKRAGKTPAGKSGANPKYPVTVTASTGLDNHITPGHLLAAITEALDIPGRDIGKIDIQKDCSYIDMSEATAKALLAYAKPIRIQKKAVTFKRKTSAKKRGGEKPAKIVAGQPRKRAK